MNTAGYGGVYSHPATYCHGADRVVNVGTLQYFNCITSS